MNQRQTGDKPWLAMGLADDMGAGEVVVRLTVEIPKRDADFLQSLADYRNALAQTKAQGDSRAKLRKRRTRKVEAESALRIACVSLREQIRPMTEELGDLPKPPDDPNDETAMAKYGKAMALYVSQMLAWDRRNT